MQLKDAIETVLRAAGKPLDAKEITDRILAEGLWQTNGKTPAATVASRIYTSIKAGEKRFVQTAPGMFCIFGGKVKIRIKRDADDSGYVYILTNPCFRKDWVKIGKTSRPVDTRSKELDNTAIPLPFEIYAMLKTSHKTKIEKLIHGLIEELNPALRIRRNREFFNIQPAKALGLLAKAAEILDEADNIVLGPIIAKAPAKKSTIQKTSKVPVLKKETWSGKTQLAKLIARRGGNEGAFGGILQYFANKDSKVRKPCHPSSKWRKPLEDACVKFDKDDFVIDWKCAKNPL